MWRFLAAALTGKKQAGESWKAKSHASQSAGHVWTWCWFRATRRLAKGRNPVDQDEVFLSCSHCSSALAEPKQRKCHRLVHFPPHFLFYIHSCCSGLFFFFFPLQHKAIPAASNFAMTVYDLSLTNHDPEAVKKKKKEQKSVEKVFHLFIHSRTTWTQFLANHSAVLLRFCWRS